MKSSAVRQIIILCALMLSYFQKTLNQAKKAANKSQTRKKIEDMTIGYNAMGTTLQILDQVIIKKCPLFF